MATTARPLLLLAAALVSVPLGLAAPAAASATAPAAAGTTGPATPTAPAPLPAATSLCTTLDLVHRGTKVVTVWGTRLVHLRVERHGRPVTVLRRVRYRHPKRVAFTTTEQRTTCPPAAPTGTLTLSASALPPTGGTVTLAFAAANAVGCTLSSSPAIWPVGAAPTGCHGTVEATLPAAATPAGTAPAGTAPAGTAPATFTFTFTVTSPAGLQATAVRAVTEQPPGPPPSAPPVTPESQAVGTYDALQRAYYDARTSLYAGLPSATCGAYSCLWPFTNATAATLSLFGTPGGSAYQPDAADRLAGLARYLQPLEQSPAGSPQPAAHQSAPAPPLGPGGATYFDDNAWVGLDLVHDYQLTADPAALAAAQRQFDFAVSGWDANPGDACPGGVFWEDIAGSQRNVTANGANAELGLELYRLTGDVTDLAWGAEMYQWVVACLGTPTGLYLDHVNADGTLNTTLWSYNQGVMIGAGTLLDQITGDTAYLAQARRTAAAAVASFGTGATLAGQGPAFNAIYFRNLLYLDTAAPDPAYRAQLQAYATTMWAQRQPSGLFDPQIGVNGTAPMVEIFSLLAGSPPLP